MVSAKSIICSTLSQLPRESRESGRAIAQQDQRGMLSEPAHRGGRRGRARASTVASARCDRGLDRAEKACRERLGVIGCIRGQAWLVWPALSHRSLPPLKYCTRRHGLARPSCSASRRCSRLWLRRLSSSPWRPRPRRPPPPRRPPRWRRTNAPAGSGRAAETRRARTSSLARRQKWCPVPTTARMRTMPAISPPLTTTTTATRRPPPAPSAAASPVPGTRPIRPPSDAAPRDRSRLFQTASQTVMHTAGHRTGS